MQIASLGGKLSHVLMASQYRGPICVASCDMASDICRALFSGKASLSTSPTATQTHWYQTVLMLETPHELKAGEAVEGTLEMEPGSSPGEKRTLSLVLSYDVVAAGQAGKVRPASYCSPRHRTSFNACSPQS